MPDTPENPSEDALLTLSQKYKRMGKEDLAKEAMRIATLQIMACADFKKPRLARLDKYDALYNGQVPKRLRQLFNIPIPVFPGMIDTLNAQHDTPVRLRFKESDPGDYFKAQKVNGAFQHEVMDSNQNSKWESKLRLVRKHAIMYGVGIPKLTATSDPEYKSELEVTKLKNFNFQPKGGLYLENHLFAGDDEVIKTESQLVQGAVTGYYDKGQVKLLLERASQREYMPNNSGQWADRLSRFKPLNLDPENNSYIGVPVHRLTEHILEIDGTRYYICFDAWTQTWLRFDKWRDVSSIDLYPWVPVHTHEDDENFLSKSYADDLFPAADATVGMFNQEMTNREKKNFGARAYDKDMFKDVRKLDEAQHRPDAIVPADTQGGVKRISEGIYKFEVAELNGTINLIDWINGVLGRNTGATDLSQGSVQEVSKKASVTFAEQKSVSKRLSWASAPFQDMMSGLGKRYLGGLKDHMPSKMAIKILGEKGHDWDQITRLDLNTTKDLDILIESTDKQREEDELLMVRREKALTAIGADPLLAPAINPKWRAEQLLSSVGGYDDADVAEALDVNSSSDKKSKAKAAQAIQQILEKKTPEIWNGATPAFMQKIVDFATDNKTTLKDKYFTLMDYAMAHTPIAQSNVERKAMEDARLAGQQQMAQPGQAAPQPGEEKKGIPGGVSRAMDIAQLAQ
jgi:hypothetical protein